jgi:tripartite-type tricarboxylate transporter receptor subunit TctC
MRAALAVVAAVLSLHAADAQTLPTQTWPTKPVKIIVSQAAGSVPDIACRIIADRLSQAIGPVYVENRPGSGNIIGAQAAARSEPDGATFFFATAAALVSNPFTYKTLPYDPARDFTPVAMAAKGPFMVLAHPDVPVRSFADIFAYEKQSPGKLSIATDGSRNFSGILSSWLDKLSGTAIAQIPYPNMNQGAQDAIAGRVQLVILAIPAAAPFIASGQLKPLAVSSAKSMPRFESVPPIADTFPGVELVGWFVFVAPTGTPDKAVRRMNTELDKILKDPGIANRLIDLGLYTEGAATPEATAAFIRAEHERWGGLTRQIGLEPQ